MSDNPDTKAALELEAVGNAAAMREALANLVDVIDRCDSGSPLWWHCGAKGVKPLKDAKAALSAPRRNCDVGTAEEQAMRLNEWCSGRHCINCQFKGGWPDECKLAWAQMPYEEGGAE